MIAKVVPPHMDKNWSFQAINATKDLFDLFDKPFVQGEFTKTQLGLE